MQTLVTRAPRSWWPRTQSSAAASSCTRWVPSPPGTTSTSAGGAVAHAWSGTMRSPFAQVTVSPSADTVKHSTPSSGQPVAHAASTSQGPMASSSSVPSKR